MNTYVNHHSKEKQGLPENKGNRNSRALLFEPVKHPGDISKWLKGEVSQLDQLIYKKQQILTF